MSKYIRQGASPAILPPVFSSHTVSTLTIANLRGGNIRPRLGPSLNRTDKNPAQPLGDVAHRANESSRRHTTIANVADVAGSRKPLSRYQKGS